MFTKSAPARIQVALNEIIREACSLVQLQASRNEVTLKIDLANDLPLALGDPLQLQQVLVNLLLNGIEAVSVVNDRPRLLVATSGQAVSGEFKWLCAIPAAGIDPKDEKRIFDAFFTTKPQGMGMGLSICHSIIEAHGGRLWAKANSDYGATLQFTLPVELRVLHDRH